MSSVQAVRSAGVRIDLELAAAAAVGGGEDGKVGEAEAAAASRHLSPALWLHGLPAAVVAHRWSRWQLHGPGDSRREWCGAGPLGVVLDFAALRRWLAEEAVRWGTRLQLGWRALDCTHLADGTLLTRLRGPTQVTLSPASSSAVA